MKPYTANFINSIVLIVLGLWGYFGSESPSMTALIPVIAGLILLVLTIWFKKGNRAIAHVAVTLTLIILIALFKPLFGSISRNNTAAIIRISVMILTSLFSMVIFVKSFIDARIKK